MTGIALDRQYPKSSISSQLSPLIFDSQGASGPYLHGDQSVVDQNFFGEEISSNSSLIASAELLIDL